MNLRSSFIGSLAMFALADTGCLETRALPCHAQEQLCTYTVDGKTYDGKQTCADDGYGWNECGPLSLPQPNAGGDCMIEYDLALDVTFYADGSVKTGTVGFQAVKIMLTAGCNDIHVFDLEFYLATTAPGNDQTPWCQDSCQAGSDWNLQNFRLLNDQEPIAGPVSAGFNLMNGPNYVQFGQSEPLVELFVIPAGESIELTLVLDVANPLPAPAGLNQGFIAQFHGAFVGNGVVVGNKIKTTGSSVPDSYFTITG